MVTHPLSPGQAQRVVIPDAVLLPPEVQPGDQDTYTVHIQHSHISLVFPPLLLTNVPVSRVAQIIFRIETVAVITERLQQLILVSFVTLKVLMFHDF